MADNVTLESPSVAGDVAAADDIGGVKFQRVKLIKGADGINDGDISDANPWPVTITDTSTQVDDAAFTPATGKIVMAGALCDDTAPDSVNEGDGGAIRMSPRRELYVQLRDAAGGERGLNVDANGAIAVVAGDGGSSLTVDGTVTIQDGGNVISVDDGGASLTIDNAALSVVGSGVEATALRVTLASDSTGVVSVDDNGSTLSVDDGGSSLTVDNAALSVVGSGTEATAQRVTIASDSTGVLSVDDNGSSLTIDGTVTASNTAGDIAHDTGDSGNPVKVGGKYTSALPTAVANNDRANLLVDRYGRVITASADIGLLKNKAATYTTAQTGAVFLDPTAGTLPVIRSVTVGTSGTTAGRLTIWYGANADSTYSEGTDRCVFDGTLTPSASATPGVVMTNLFMPAAAANDEIHVTTSADVDVHISIWYTEETP